jgi:hypothetical protein
MDPIHQSRAPGSSAGSALCSPLTKVLPNEELARSQEKATQHPLEMAKLLV